MPVYYDEKGKFYKVRMYITDVYGNRKQKQFGHFKTKREALKAEAETKLIDGEYTEVQDMTLESLYKEFRDYKKNKVKPQGFRTLMSRIDNHILPYFRKSKIKQIDHIKYVKWQNAIEAKNFSHKYKASLHQAFSTLLDYAIDFHRLEINVAKKVGNFKRNSEVKRKANCWDYEEYCKFINVVDDIVYKTLFETLYFTGMRIGEALALNWNDLNNSCISVNKTIAKDIDKKTGKHFITSPKTLTSNREIKIDDKLNNHLEELKKYYKDNISFENNWFIFGGLKPLAQTTVGNRFKKYIELSNVKKIKIHEIRHSHASLLISIGTPATVIQKRLGHSDLQTTLNTYSHMLPKDEDKAVLNIANLRQKSKF